MLVRFTSRLRFLAPAGVVAGLLLAPATSAEARITRLDMTRAQPAFAGASFGDVGRYELLSGIATALWVAPPQGLLMQAQLVFQMAFGSLLIYAMRRPIEASGPEVLGSNFSHLRL